MKDVKLETITNLFEGNTIRSVWDSEKEDYYFSVVDVITILTSSNNPRDYWYRLKKRMKEEERSELSTKCRQLKLKSSDGKFYNTEVLDTEGIFRLIESVPSPKAEPFKMWLAKLGKEHIDEVFDPELAINRAIDYYQKRGYDEDWIAKRLSSILNRKKLTNTWLEHGINKNIEFGILTNEIYKSWSGMTAREYKDFKGLRKESLRDNMSDIEVALTELGEITTRDIIKSEHPVGLEENIYVAKRGGKASKVARDYYESETGKKAISNENAIGGRYVDENKLINTKEQK